MVITNALYDDDGEEEKIEKRKEDPLTKEENPTKINCLYIVYNQYYINII